MASTASQSQMSFSCKAALKPLRRVFFDGTGVNGRKSTNNPDGGPNGPGCGGGVAVCSRKIELYAGDVLIVPPGVIHGWFDNPDHVDYLSFRPSRGIMKNGWVNPTIAPK